MKARAAVLPLLSFATGALAVVGWPPSTAGTGGGFPRNQEGRPGFAPPAVSGAAAGAQGNSATGPRTGSAGNGARLLTGLDKPPSMEDVLDAAGLERNLRMGVWLQTASSADMAAMLDRCRDAGIYDRTLTDAVWLRWTEVDREAALKHQSGHEAWWALAKVDPDAAVEAARQADPMKLKEVIRSIGQSHHEKALELLAKYPQADSRLAWEGIIADMRDDQLPAAAALALEKGVELKDTVEAWMERDPGAALAWAKGQEDPTKRRRVMELALEQLRTSDPAAAHREAGELPPGRARSEQLAKAMAALAVSDPRHTAETMALVKNAPQAGDRTLAYAEMAAGLAASDPQGALEAFRELTAAGFPSDTGSEWTYQSGASRKQGGINTQAPVSAAMTQLMAVEPEATMTLLAGMPEKEGQDLPVYSAVKQWANQDPAAVSGWIEKQPSGPFKNEAVSGLTHWLLHESPEPDPEAAAAWSMAASPDNQKGLLLNSFQGWHEEDPAAARAGADRLPMTAEQRDAVLRNLDALDRNAERNKQP